MKKLGYDFYRRNDVVKIARELLGKLLITKWNGQLTSGRIVETEAYNGVADRASHAFNGRRTARTEVMFGDAGTGYVYFCYGIHHLFNVVTNAKDIPHAVLIRAIEPLEGIAVMLQRTGKSEPNLRFTSGPGNVAKAMGIHTVHSGISLLGDTVFLADDGFLLDKKEIIATPRIGVDYALEDALLPYRFIIKDHPFVSGKKK
ncbi:MAG: DNA-3-methyladenine glycosylase [Chitinophagaceae bacterium]|nr:DNA-3-methyladenine glycosylase [Chitinophagaceae bacterium]